MQSFPSSGIKYGHLRIKDGHYIGSKWIKRNRDWTRINYSVMVSYSIYCIQSNLDIPNSWFRNKSSVYGRCSVNQNLFIYRTL